MGCTNYFFRNLKLEITCYLNKFAALVALLLELAVGLGWLLEFVESSVHSSCYLCLKFG